MNIAVTGGIGSGKSLVSVTLATILNSDLASADKLCRELLEPGAAGYKQMRKQFPDEFFLENHRLNRAHLRKNIFIDEHIRTKVDTILHPLVRAELRMQCDAAKQRKVDLVAEVPLLFEKKWQNDFDFILVVYADEDTCIQRIVARDAVSTEDARNAIASQMGLLEKCAHADLVIENSDTIAVTRKQLENFYLAI